MIKHIFGDDLTHRPEDDFPPHPDDVPFANADEARAYMRKLLEPFVSKDGLAPEPTADRQSGDSPTVLDTTSQNRIT